MNQFEALKFILRQFAGRTKSHLSEFNSKRTVVLSCASLLPRTLKTDTEELIKDWFPGIKIVKGQNYLKISEKIEHESFSVEKIDESEKKLLTKQLIDRYYEGMIQKRSIDQLAVQSKKVLVFTNSSISTEELCNYLNQSGLQATKLHSKMRVNERIKNMSEFKEGKYLVMVCTDVGARGLDFDNLDMVIQYDFAKNATILLHRFGRTGRLNRPGKVISLI